MKRKLLFVALIVILVLCTFRIDPYVASADEWATYRIAIINWIKNCGVISGNTIHQGVVYAGGWHVDSSLRIDAQCEVAMAFLYEYRLTNDDSYKTKALSLLKQSHYDSVGYQIYPHKWHCTGYSSVAYTQDNGRVMRAYALGIEITGDTELINILTELCDYWVTKIPANGGVGVGYNSVRSGNWLDPPQYPCARHIGEFLTGMVRAYDVLHKTSYLDAANRLGSWLVYSQQSDGRWIVPGRTQELYNGGLGNEAEAASLSLRGLSELYRVTNNATYLSAADKAYSWILAQCEQANNAWHRGRLLCEKNRSPDLRYFNTLYLQVPASLLRYAQCCSNEDAQQLGLEMLRFMCGTMMQHGSATVEGGICGEWDLSSNTRSQFSDDENMVWGNWIFTGWTNCESVEALAIFALGGGPSPPPPPGEFDYRIIFAIGTVGFLSTLLVIGKRYSRHARTNFSIRRKR